MDTRLMTQMKLNQMKSQVADAADRVAPMATQARDAAQDRLYMARGWAAPRLDAAAHSIEEQIAPKVSAILSQAAARVDPTPRTRSRTWPMFLLLTGLAVGAVGYAMYRRNADQWTDMVKDSASDASRWVGEKAETAANRAAEMKEHVASKTETTTGKAGEKVKEQADQASNKMP